MSKTKKSNSARYEILYIVSNEFSEDEVKGIDDKIQKIIEDNNGTNITKQNLGKKRLAYKIQNFDYGYYNLIIFDTEKEKIANIDRLIRQMREILRYCIVLYVESKIPEEDNKINSDKDKTDKKIDTKNIKEEKIKKPVSNKPTQSPDKDVENKQIKDEKIIKNKEVKKETTASKPKPLETTTKDKKSETKKESTKNEEDKDSLDKKLDDILEAKNLF